MKRSGWAALAFLPLAIALMGLTCHEGKEGTVTTTVARPPTESKAPAMTRPGNLVDLKGRVWRVPGVIGTAKLPCEETTKETSGPGAGGFVCSTVHRIWLDVAPGGSGITVDPQKLEVHPGECILWETRAADNTPALITGIDFVDPGEQIPPNKFASSHRVGRVFCTAGTSTCVKHISLDDGKYSYEVSVRHDGTIKKSDPEIEVSCPTCDPPPASGS